MFRETLEEITAEIFGDSGGMEAELLRPQGGFHVINDPTAPRISSPQRLAYQRAHTRKAALARIRALLLAGERPKKRCGTPVRWIEVAKELGIDLGMKP